MSRQMPRLHTNIASGEIASKPHVLLISSTVVGAQKSVELQDVDATRTRTCRRIDGRGRSTRVLALYRVLRTNLLIVPKFAITSFALPTVCRGSFTNLDSADLWTCRAKEAHCSCSSQNR